jgi:SAM-dependent methyltransferase
MKIPGKKIIKGIIFTALSFFTVRDLWEFRGKLNGDRRFLLRLRDLFPRLGEKTATTKIERHYVLHAAWAARCIAEIKPAVHVDVGSTVWFCSIVSAFVPVKFYDYRPAALDLSNLESLPGSLHALPFADNELQSISCLHTVEHVGLGRYGDPIDPEGDIKAIRELQRVVAPGGSLLVVVPMGNTARIEFNAHRIYSYDLLVSYFSGFDLVEFAYIPEKEKDGGLKRHAKKEDLAHERHACACFWFRKK